MSLFSVDVEADGACPHLFSMVSFGAVIIRDGLEDTFFGQVRPISDNWIPEALAISDISREEHLRYKNPSIVMHEFAEWITKNTIGRPTLVSDNPAFDWQWINYYFHRFTDCNPFGFSARRIGDLYCGLVKDASKNRDWKRLRKTKHTHNPVDDAMGNAEVVMKLKRDFGLKIGLK